MLKFLKNIFGEEEKRSLAIAFCEIPAWLDMRRTEAEDLLEASTKKEREEIRAAASELSHVVEELLAAQFNEDLHPKLKSIAKKSLPQYFKAIHGALEKPLPDEPEAFYAAAAELLKACINSARGQGKYLKTVFPEEMRSVESCVAIIGRGINTMNEPFKAYRQVTTQVAEASKLHDALVDMYEDSKRATEKGERLDLRIREINERIAALERDSADLEQRRAEKDLREQEEAISGLKKARDLTVHRYSALSMTASHVLRKAEKVARRQQKSLDERVIAKAIAILSDHGVPDCGDLVATLDAAYLPARRMIDAGEVVLKNKEERGLFASQEEFTAAIRDLCTCYADQSSRCDAAGRAFAAHPVILRHVELMGEMNQLFESLAKEKKAAADLRQWHEDLKKAIPPVREQLQKTLVGIVGGDVQVSYPDSPSTAPRG